MPFFPWTVVIALYIHLPPIIYQPHPTDEDDPPRSSTETSSLLSEPGDVDIEDDAASRHSKKPLHSHCLDITGFALLAKLEFWQLWILMGLLTGVGIMTIKYTLFSTPSIL